jgi:hypothetical protein
VVPALFSFTTAGDTGNRYDEEDWIPDAGNLRGDWRSKRVNSEAQSLPPLQAAEGVTALAGQVLTLNGRPLAGVSLQIGSASAQTDQTGRFLLTNVATGHQVMRLDGRPASVPSRTYGTFKIGVDITDGKTNLLGYTIWMPKLDTAHAVNIQSPTTKQTVITNPHIPGLELRLPAQTVIRDMDANTVTQLTITPIPTNRAGVLHDPTGRLAGDSTKSATDLSKLYESTGGRAYRLLELRRGRQGLVRLWTRHCHSEW